MSFFIGIARTLAIMGGLILCYGALFLYEDEERAVQNALEYWWVRIDDLSNAAVARHVAITRVAAEFARHMLDRLFGVKAVSRRMVAVSGCLSLASLHFVSMYLAGAAQRIVAAPPIPPRHATPQDIFFVAIPYLLWATASILLLAATPVNPTVMHIVGGAAISVVILALIWPRLRALPGVFCSVILICLAGFAMFARPSPDWLGLPEATLMAIFVGVICDVAAINATRRLVILQTRWTSFAKLSVAAATELLLAIALLVLPVLVGFTVLARTAGHSLHGGLLGWGVLLAPTTNVLTALTLLALFGALALLLVHRTVWPMISRPLYKIARIGIFRSAGARTLLFGVGSAAVAIGMGQGESVLQRVMSLLGSA